MNRVRHRWVKASRNFFDFVIREAAEKSAFWHLGIFFNQVKACHYQDGDDSNMVTGDCMVEIGQIKGDPVHKDTTNQIVPECPFLFILHFPKNNDF